MTDKPQIYAQRRLAELLGEPPDVTNLYAHNWEAELEIAFGQGMLEGLRHDQALIEQQAAVVRNANALVQHVLQRGKA